MNDLLQCRDLLSDRPCHSGGTSDILHRSDSLHNCCRLYNRHIDIDCGIALPPLDRACDILIHDSLNHLRDWALLRDLLDPVTFLVT